MHPRAKEFADCARDRYDIQIDVHEFEEGTKTAAEAATAVGCELAQIASGIVMDAEGLVVIVTSGANRVSAEALADLRNVPATSVNMADADRIRDTLGWAIGGVPPFCHDTVVPVYLDETLTEFDTVWAAAGTPNAVFPIAPDRLVGIADAQIADIAE